MRHLLLPSLLLPYALAALVLVTPSTSSASVAPAGAISSPTTRSPALRTTAPTATRATTDNRSAIIESNLRSINRSLDASRPASPALPQPSACPSCGDRVQVPPRNQARTDPDSTLRGSLHKLKRETNIQQSSDPRRARIEASQPD